MPVISEKSVFSSGGKTLISLAANNNHLIVVNKHGLTRILHTNSPEEEPEILETCHNPTSLTVFNDVSTTCPDFCITSIKGDAHHYKSASPHSLILRTALPIRDSTVVHNGKMVAIAGDDLELFLVELAEGDGDQDFKKHSVKLPDQVSKLSYNPQMNILSASLVDGSIQFFSLTSTRPNELKTLKNYVLANFYNDDYESSSIADERDDEETYNDPEYCDENRITTRVEWHPKGMQFALPCKDNTVKIFDFGSYSLTKTLTSSSIKSHFTDLKFSPVDGLFIAATDLTNRLTIWNSKTGDVHYSRQLDHKVTNICWKLDQSSSSLQLLFGTWTGEVVTISTIADFTALSNVTAEQSQGHQQQKLKGNGLFVNSDDEDSDIPPPSPQKEINNAILADFEAAEGARDEDEDEDNHGEEINSQNVFTDNEDEQGTPMTTDLDGGKRKFHYEDEEDFIDDDDGAGYVDNRKKRARARVVPGVPAISRHTKASGFSSGPVFRYKPISPGGTPFGSGDRRYLTMNNIGYVWTVRSSSGNSVTVSFFDLGRFKEYHFEDLFSYDVCSLTEESALFASSKTGQLHCKPHDNFNSTWTKKVPLQKEEKITSIAATSKRVIVGTSFGYVRIFNQFGVPISLEKMSPIVAITAQEDKIFTVHYSLYHGVSYSLFENGTQGSGRYYQRECPLPISLPENSSGEEEYASSSEVFTNFNPIGIKSLFFSTFGDPCVFGNDNVLLVLSKWRNQSESRWIPIVDTGLEIWKMSGGKQPDDLHVWPLGFTYDVLNYILVKGKSSWPEFPLPLPSEMEVRIPLLIKDQVLVQEGDDEISIPPQMAAEEEFMRSKILAELLNDTLEHDGEMYGNENDILNSLAGIYDKSLLRLFAGACSDQNTDKALSLVQELRQDKALNAAVKIAERAELMSLVRKIGEIREARFEQQLNEM